MEYGKLQIGCMLIVLYVVFIYIREKRAYKVKKRETIFEMKTHARRGGNIIQETFGKMGNDEYGKIAYEVARHHHEKWNGTGYPDGLSRKEIPLCARIMAVADVFDMEEPVMQQPRFFF